MQPNTSFNNNRFKRVLIVEPAADLRIKIARALQSACFKIYAVENGETALQLSRQLGLPNLALVEMNLPDMNGAEMALRLQQTRQIPIILTGYLEDEEAIANILDNQTEDFVRKPFDVREIVARVQRILNRTPIHHSFTLGNPTDSLEQQEYLRNRFKLS